MGKAFPFQTLICASWYLRVLVSGTADTDWFLERAKQVVEEFDRELKQAGGGFEDASSIVDIGCGCGRLSRWVLNYNENFFGVDINPKLLRWSRNNLRGEWALCKLKKSMPYPDRKFDLAYACSVITHLREDTAREWLADVSRILQFGGRFLLTFHDEKHPNSASIKADLETGYAVRFDSLEGSNHLAAFCTIEKLEEMMPGDMRLVRYTPSDRSDCLQAISIWEKVSP
ncbi:MAG: class I SAM-dependent methyltransferase [Caulobacteraceae bacterium]